jgi:hypothetical protein
MEPSKSKGVMEKIVYFRPFCPLFWQYYLFKPSCRWSLVRSTHTISMDDSFTRLSWYNSALFGADQAWSGYYERDDSAPVVWATAQ